MSEAATGLYAELADHLARHDKAAAVRTAVEAVTGGRVTVMELYGQVLQPLLVETGHSWQRGKVAIWQEHLATATVRAIVEILYPVVLRIRAAAKPSGRSVLLACPPEEHHDLGLRMVADRFDMAGWRTYYLGADTPSEEIVDAARRLGVDAVVLTSSTHFQRLILRHAVDLIKEALPDVDVWVGGAAFVHHREGWTAGELVDLDEILGEPDTLGGVPGPAEGQ
jgi:methanogenic corrinoid protein MtbC1